MTTPKTKKGAAPSSDASWTTGVGSGKSEPIEPELPGIPPAPKTDDPVPPQKPKRGRPPGSKTKARREVEEEEPVTLDAIVSMTTVLCSGLALVVDESFAPFLPGTTALDPRILDGSAQLYPFLKKYGGSIAQLSPWIGLAMGCMTILGPGFGPSLEIIAGTKAPRIFRDPPAAATVVEMVREEKPAPKGA